VVNDIINEANVSKTAITKQYLKQELEAKLGIVKRKKEITLYEFTTKIIEDMTSGKLKTVNGSNYEKTTIKQFKALSSILEFFKPDTQFYQIDESWYNDYICFCRDKQEINDKNGNIIYTKEAYENSTLSNKINKLRQVMDFAIDKKISTNKNNREKWFKNFNNGYEVSKTDLYLTENEIQRIYDYVPKDKSMEKAKDLFLIGAYSGLRVSDYLTLTRENFKKTDKGLNVLDVVMKKVKGKVVIPILFEELIKIAEKYDYNFPKLTEKEINRNIKEVCRLIGGSFNEKIDFYTGKGGKIIKETKPKYSLICTHTGRRSCLTNLIAKGLSESDASKVSGHKSVRMVARYNKLSSTETADTLSTKYNKLSNE
jgi:integrase